MNEILLIACTWYSEKRLPLSISVGGGSVQSYLIPPFGVSVIAPTMYCFALLSVLRTLFYSYFYLL